MSLVTDGLGSNQLITQGLGAGVQYIPQPEQQTIWQGSGAGGYEYWLEEVWQHYEYQRQRDEERRQAKEDQAKRRQEQLEAEAARIAQKEAERERGRQERLAELSERIETATRLDAVIQEAKAFEHEIERLQAEINAQYRAEQVRNRLEKQKVEEQEIVNVMMLMLMEV